MRHHWLHHQFVIIWLSALLLIDCVPIDNAINYQAQHEHNPSINDVSLNPPSNNYNDDRNGKIKTKTFDLSSPLSSARILITTHHHHNPVSSNDNPRQSRCLVEAILYSRSLKDDGHGHNKPVTFNSESFQLDGSSDHGVIKSRMQRSPGRDRRALAYYTLGQSPSHADNLAFIGVVPDADGKIYFPAGPFAQYRPPTLFTLNGFKVWGPGTESKFGPVLEYFVQRIQSYYSVYKYEDLSRPGFDYIKPKPKPGDIADNLEAIPAELPLTGMVIN